MGSVPPFYLGLQEKYDIILKEYEKRKMRMAQWFIAAKKADFERIAEKYGIDPVIARIIRNRDVISDEEICKYLNGGREDFYAPALLKDMDQAAVFLKNKIEAGAKIRVIGDYDADGICSSYILTEGMSACGGDVDTVIPHRVKDGYGLNDSLIADAHAEGIDTIVTCDNGIAAASQIAYARELGMAVIVTDHHEIPYEEDAQGKKCYLLPEAEAVVDPQREDCTYPWKGICGAVVAYKLIQQLFMLMHPEGEEELLEEALEFAAFATVCDVMELQDENRLIVKCGLKHMKNTRNIGLKALIEVCGLEGRELTAYHMGFVLGPCINSTGRLDTAKRALSLFQSRERAEAVQLAGQLRELNDSRKEMTLEGTGQAIDILEKEGRNRDMVLVVYLPECHESLAGIIAGRLKDKYGKPSFVLTKGEEGLKGSGRSVESYHMYEELSACKELFTKYGGHKMAAGLSMPEENLEPFRRKINENCRLTEEELEEKIHIDVALPFSCLTREFVDELTLLEPFGVGNPKPVFAQKNIHMISERIVGKNQNIGKYRVKDEQGATCDMMYYGDLSVLHSFLEETADTAQTDRLFQGMKTDIPLSITYYPAVNSFNGRETIQIVMQKYRKGESL